VLRRIAVTKRRHAGRISLIAVVGIVISLGLVACGSSGASKEELSEAASKGAHHKAEQERLRKLEKELKDLHKGQNSNSPVPSPAPTPEPAPPPSGTDCGEGLTAGPSTTCLFAENVRSEYEDHIGAGSGTVEAFSAANNKVYDMFCTAGSPHECSGAIDATVYFP
jgi:hypothetical protein